jgi:hypothetical protein
MGDKKGTDIKQKTEQQQTGYKFFMKQGKHIGNNERGKQVKHRAQDVFFRKKEYGADHRNNKKDVKVK